MHKLNTEERKKIRDNAFHNTRTLLVHYDKLKAHCEVIDEQLYSSLDFWCERRLRLDSLLESKAKTSKLMTHVDLSVEKLKISNRKSYDLLKMKYLNKNKLSDVELSAEYNIERSVMTKRIKTALEDLAVILFGAEVILTDLS